MTAFWAAPVTGFALCWRILRRDGVALGFTTHDRDLEVDGLRHRAAPGAAPSAVDGGAAGDGTAFDITGAVSAAAITEADLAAGRWDGATVRLLAVDWSDPTQRVVLAEGRIGAVTFARGRFTAQVRGPEAALDRPIAEETSPECRAELGDARCRVPLAARTRIARVTGAAGDALTLDIAEPVANAWGWGRLRWIDGANAGLTQLVLASAGARLALDAPPRAPVAAGARVELVEGCDKRLATCAARFGNAANFRGEPHLPGIDLLMRYPGA